MTLRVAASVLLAVALVAAATPGMQAARERATMAALAEDADDLAAAVDAVADAPVGTRRVVAIDLPEGGVGTAAAGSVTIAGRAVRYRLESGNRGGTALPTAVSGRTGDGVVLDAIGTHRVAVVRTTAGVVVERVGHGPSKSDPDSFRTRTLTSMSSLRADGELREPRRSFAETSVYQG